MKRKLFISINIPERDRKRLIKATEHWSALPVKWVREQNLHITLFFIGYVDTESIPDICQKVRDAAENQEIFDMEFSKIELHPADDPRMIWVVGEASEELRKLYEEIEKELGIFTHSKKSFRPHITLGRIRKRKWQDLEDKPLINENYSLLITAETVDIMASDFGDGGQEYTLIESCPLK